jgi:hypothetical protein
MRRLMSLGALGYGMWFLWNASETSENLWAACLIGFGVLLEFMGRN